VVLGGVVVLELGDGGSGGSGGGRHCCCSYSRRKGRYGRLKVEAVDVEVV
jgi:hypothetical protein